MALIVIDKEKCKGCELCIRFCKKDCIEMDETYNSKGYRFSRCKEDSECTGCAMCAQICPDVAIEVWR